MSEWVARRVSERASEQRTEQQQAKNGNSNGNKCWFHIRFEKRRQNGKSLFDRLLCSKRKTTKGILRRTLVRIQYTVTHKQHSIACTILYCGLWTRYEAVSLWACEQRDSLFVYVFVVVVVVVVVVLGGLLYADESRAEHKYNGSGSRLAFGFTSTIYGWIWYTPLNVLHHYDARIEHWRERRTGRV